MSINFKFQGKFNRTTTELGVALLAALVAAGGIWYWMVNLYDARDAVAVVAAAVDLGAPRKIAAADIKELYLPRETLPQNAIADPQGIVGQLLTRSVSKNEIITAADLVYDRDASSESALVPFGKIGFVLPQSWLAAPFPKVKKNDFITLFASFRDRGGAPTAGVLLRAVPIYGTRGGDVPDGLVLGLAQDDLGRLMQARMSQYQIIAVVESAQAVPMPAAATSTPR